MESLEASAVAFDAVGIGHTWTEGGIGAAGKDTVAVEESGLEWTELKEIALTVDWPASVGRAFDGLGRQLAEI
jgi:hypothetical protein